MIPPQGHIKTKVELVFNSTLKAHHPDSSTKVPMVDKILQLNKETQSSCFPSQQHPSSILIPPHHCSHPQQLKSVVFMVDRWNRDSTKNEKEVKSVVGTHQQLQREREGA